MAKKWFVIVNPNAGKRKIKHDWPEINMLLTGAKLDFKYLLTKGPLDAIELVKKAIADGERNFIAVGGDGTFNEVANGIFSQAEVNYDEFTLAAIPVGTGNDWGRMFKIPADYKQAVEIINKGQTFVQDVGIVEYRQDESRQKRYFLNVAGIGFYALVARKTNKQKESGKKAGAFSYFTNLLTSLFEYKPKQIQLEVDGKSWEFNTFSLTVGICRFNGGGMMQSPLAIPDDGLLDVTVIKKIGMGTLALQLKNLYNGTFIRHPKVFTGRGSRVKINSAKSNFSLEADGESLGQGPFEFFILPGALRVVIGKKNF
jgi:YegS/Rv2252/BmrU family lipid kinase